MIRALRLSFNWHHEGRPALLCPRCKAEAAGARMTGRPEPEDGQ
jgi:hypothetical protein